jgi:hypothetical protein
LLVIVTLQEADAGSVLWKVTSKMIVEW